MDSKGALAELKSFQGSRKGAGDYQSQFQQELGVGDAQSRSNDIRSQIRNTEGALKGVNASVAGRTRGNLVTEAQRARLEGLERAPIANELGTLQGAFSDEQTNYRDLLGQATTRAGQAYQTDADRLAGLESNYGKLFQQEQAAAEATRWQQQQAEQARQWQSQFDESRRQFEGNLANTRNQFAQQASFSNQARQDALDAAARERAGAVQPQATPRLSAPGILSGANYNNATKGGYFKDLGKNIGQGFQNVAKYGPLALFGKGSIW